MSTERTVYAKDDGVIIFHCGGTGTYHFVYDGSLDFIGFAATVDEGRAMIAASNLAKGYKAKPKPRQGGGEST